MFGVDEISKVNMSKKWTINTFISKSTPRTQLSSTSEGLSPEVKADFQRAVKEAELRFNKLDLQYDKVYSDLTQRRLELKALITEYQASARPQDVALFWNADIQLLTNQIKIIENKQKLSEAKFKNLRDEKKAVKDFYKADTPAVQVNTQNNPIVTNNPIAVASANEQVGGPISVSGFTNVGITKPKSMLIEEAKPSETISIPSPTTAEQTVVETPSRVEEIVEVKEHSIPLSGDNMFADEIITVGDVASEQNERIKARLANRDKSLELNTTMNNSYTDSLAALVNKRKDIKEKVYINVNNNTFYTRAFELNPETKKYDIEVKDYHYKSVVHLGQLRINTLHKTCNTYYYPDTLEYELVRDDSEMPDVYKQWWEEPKAEKFKLTDDTITALIESE